MKYSYTEPGERYVLVDVSHFLPTNDEVNRAQFYSNGQLEVSDGGKTYKGYGIWRGGFNDGPDYTVFFCGEFSSTPKSAKLFTGPYTDPYWPNTTDSRPTWLNDSSSVTGGTTGYQYSNRIGALFEFDGSASEVMSKVGVSWISAEKACKFVDDEVDGWDFDGTVQTAKKTWNDEVFSKITTTDFKNVTRLTMFYSALYKMHLIPRYEVCKEMLLREHPGANRFFSPLVTGPARVPILKQMSPITMIITLSGTPSDVPIAFGC